jgi:DNA-binding MarR family transcriptional regulator
VRQNQEDEIAENALFFFPFMKRLLRGDAGEQALTPFRNQSCQVLRVLEKHGPLPMSEIGKRLFIAKQNMTAIVDKLMAEGLVQRKNDEEDRRVIKIVITPRGIESLEAAMLALKEIIKRNLSCLSGEDIEALHGALQTVRIVSLKVESGDCHART